MRGTLLIPLGITLLFAYSFAQIETSTNNAERLKALCARYKFLWSDADPDVFYYCFTNKAAVQLKCKAGYYMCKREGKPFHPCDCKHGDDNSNLAEGGGSVEETTGEYSSSGCPDPFLKYANYHRHGGIERSDLPTLALCQRECFIDEGCIGLDWEAENKLCFLLFKEAEQYGISSKEGIDHYMRTKCSGTYGVTPKTNEVEAPDENLENLPSSVNPDPGNANGSFDRQELDEFFNALGGREQPDGKQGFISTLGPAIAIVNGLTTTQATLPTVAPTVAVTNAPGPLNGVTIPDQGCPDPMQAYPDTRQHAGVNITTATLYRTAEECKFYCLLHSGYCKGVDFDSNTNTCYRHTELKIELRQTGATGVTHYEILQCGRQLVCYEISGLTTDPNITAIVDPAAPKIPCRGYCITKLTLSTTGAGVLDRGCVSESELLALGVPDVNTRVFVNPTIPQQIIVTCTTGLCNGLSIPAATATMLHLALDGDTQDSTGMGRHGFPVDQNSPPSFTTLSALLNGSAVLTGQMCIEVPSLANYAYGSVDPSGINVPQFSLSFAFKRFNDGIVQPVGLIGNSKDPNIPPSIAVMGVSGYNNYYKAGVATDNRPGKTDDYIIRAEVNQWHHFVLTYDGRDLIQLNKPELIVYLAGEALTSMGNAKDDKGDLPVRNDPFYIGCIPGVADTVNFSGMIDEVRLFSTALGKEDVQALNLITEASILDAGL